MPLAPGPVVAGMTTGVPPPLTPYPVAPSPFPAAPLAAHHGYSMVAAAALQVCSMSNAMFLVFFRSLNTGGYLRRSPVAHLLNYIFLNI